MKLDASHMRSISPNAFRVLTAVELGSKNHLVVPTPLIQQLSSPHGSDSNCQRFISELAKLGLIARVQNAQYDGYRLTYGGYDYLALKAFSKRDTIYAVGNQIGVGKESDIYVVANKEGSQHVLKIHRLGRISFRTVKENRDYLKHRKSASWMYLSRLSAQTEYEFMKILHANGFPVPLPIDQNRHCVIMSLIDAFPLVQVKDVVDPGALYDQLIELLMSLARQGLIHGDFNEFNILYSESTLQLILIDFPQMISINHINAKEYFERDVKCIVKFFERKFLFSPKSYPVWTDVIRQGNLDNIVGASGANDSRRQAIPISLAADGTSEEDADQGGQNLESD